VTPTPIVLYWMTTDDHEEDWFVLAADPRSALSYHLGYEVLAGHQDAKAEAILGIPNPSALPKGQTLPRRATLADLATLGFQCCSGGLQKIVRYQGRTFIEGDLELSIMTSRDDYLEGKGKGRPNGTARSGSVLISKKSGT